MRLAVVSLLIGLSLISISSGKAKTRPDERRLLAPPKDLQHFTLGYNESVSDSIWLRVIQDIDFCDRKANGEVGDTPTQRDVPEAQNHSGEIPPGGWSAHDPGRCRDNSWVFSMLDSVTTLTPRFRIPYSAGGTILSVVVRDYGGSTVIFERGIKEFPNDWPLLYKAAFHYLYDLGDQKRAAELLVLAGRNGGPEWVYSLAAKLYTAEGQAFLAKSVLQDVLENDPNARFAKRLQQRLDEAEAVLQHQTPAAPDAGAKPNASPDHP